MTLLAPLALGFGLSLPILLVFYLLKVRRADREVSSALLWQTLRRDLAAHQPWQRLRWSVLLVAQLILLGLLTLVLSRPASEAGAAGGSFAALIVDTSASMRATDVAPSRFEQARQAALNVVNGLPEGATAALIEAGLSARVVVPETADRGALRAGLASLRPTDGADSSIDATLRLAGALARGRPSATVQLFSDGAYDHPSSWDDLTDVSVRFHQVGTAAGNRAITALELGPDLATTPASTVPPELFARVQNFDDRSAQVTAALSVDGQVVESRQINLAANGSQQLFFGNLPSAGRLVQLQLSPPGALITGEVARLVLNPPPTTSVLLVSQGNLFLEKALQSIPGLAVYQVTPRDYPAVDLSTYSVLVFDGYLPDQPPTKNALVVNPPDVPWLPVQGILRDPAITSWNADDPSLAYVDLSTVHISRAANVSLPAWAHLLIGSAAGPLGFAGIDAGHQIVGLTFDLQQSDLPLSTAFPIFVSNVMHVLAPPTADQATAIVPGSSALIARKPGVDRIVVTDPIGTMTTMSATGDATSHFDQTGLTGVYQVAQYAGQAQVDSTQFAVDQLDPNELDLRPRANLVDRDPSSGGSTGPSPLISREFAPWLLLLAIPIMLGEWWWYHRR